VDRSRALSTSQDGSRPPPYRQARSEPGESILTCPAVGSLEAGQVVRAVDRAVRSVAETDRPYQKGWAGMRANHPAQPTTITSAGRPGVPARRASVVINGHANVAASATYSAS
jgi:hypothetical protein